MKQVGVVLGLSIALSVAGGSSAFGARQYHVKYLENRDGSLELLSEGWSAGRAAMRGLSEFRYPQTVVEHQPIDSDTVVEVFGKDKNTVWKNLSARGLVKRALARDTQRDEVRTLIQSGPSDNRIDLVFMGDGYTAAEKQKFFSDAQRLTDEMFNGNTFHSYLPLFNVHAVFRASRESGIGKGNPIDTAYGLYREGVTLRAIFPDNPSAARSSCAQAPGCDYPIIMANDPLYGGLGGEFAITTSSLHSGTKVLRHELGHNFGRVGEEYDGGGYFGANHASQLSNITWKHWLSGPLKSEPARALYIGWPWHALADGEFTATFRSPGGAAFYEIQYGASGFETDDTLHVTLDGSKLNFTGNGHEDREFKEFLHQGGLSAGNHVLKIKELIKDGDNWVSDLTVYEYETGYSQDPHNVSAYPVFLSANQPVGYRATHETCLMRNMKSTRFCPICQENNWMHFLAKIELIDEVKKTTPAGATSKVAVQVLQLGQLRPIPLVNESLEISWYKDGQLQPQLQNRISWEASAADEGSWKVVVKLITPEVRKDPLNYLVSEKSFRL